MFNRSNSNRNENFHLQVGSRIHILLLVALTLFNISCGNSAGATVENPNAKVFSIHRVTTDGKIVVLAYTSTTATEHHLGDLEIWPELLGKDYRQVFYFDTEPDWKLYLLSRGHARLRDPSQAASQYVEAQNRAREQRVGLWAQAQAQNTPSPDTDSGGSNPIYLFYVLITIVIAVTGWFGGSAFIKLVLAWWRSREVPLILLGRPSTGKSWLWHRLLYPDISINDLEKIDRSLLSVKQREHRTKPLGRFEVRPLYVDTPGGRSGEQVSRLLEEKSLFNRLKRLVIRAKSVWLITLATTPNVNVRRDSAEREKLDDSYIEQQLGHLDLPVGMLSSDRAFKPQMVIACITKFDLFSSHDPRDSMSADAKKKLEQIFRRHTSRIENECKSQGIPFKLIMCSARESWGTTELWQHVERAIFQ